MGPDGIRLALFTAVLTAAYFLLRMLAAGWERLRAAYTRGAEAGIEAAWLRLRVGHLLLAALVAAIVLGSAVGLLVHPLAVPVGILAGLLLPSLLLHRFEHRRRQRFAEQLPEGLDALAGSLRAGLSLEGGLGVLARESPSPLGEELRLTVAEMRLGVPLGESLDRLQGRMGNDDLALAVDAIAVATESGGSLADTLDELVRTVRERRRVEGRLRALTAQGRMQAWVVGLLPFALAGILAMMEPMLVRDFFASPVGWGAVGVVLVLEGIALVWIRRILRIDA